MLKCSANFAFAELELSIYQIMDCPPLSASWHNNVNDPYKTILVYIYISVDIFLKKENSRGAKLLIQTLCSKRHQVFQKKYTTFCIVFFSVIINSKLLKFYTPGVGNTVHTKGRI